MQRCRCGECCKGRFDDPRTPPCIVGSPPFMRGPGAVESCAPLVRRAPDGKLLAGSVLNP
jgi:hypothetical protein